MAAARLTREAILKAVDFTEKEVEVKEWGGTVLIRSLSVRDRAIIAERCTNPDGSKDMTRFDVATIIQGVKEPKLEAGDIEALQEKNGVAVDLLSNAIWALSGLRADAAKNESGGASS